MKERILYEGNNKCIHVELIYGVIFTIYCKKVVIEDKFISFKNEDIPVGLIEYSNVKSISILVFDEEYNSKTHYLWEKKRSKEKEEILNLFDKQGYLKILKQNNLWRYKDIDQ